ncbi:hypothetical protein [Luteimonas aquatica]|uniref:hypothetical protein n=1 Tax=Luteimonas aquatica TaxID=450364 RepID=UPI001F577AA0|nr:hypothetical protein [Luteimonas aquatica]
MMHKHIQTCPRRHPGTYSDAGCMDRFRALMDRVLYRDWKPIVSDMGAIPYLQITAIMEDSVAGGLMENNTRPIALCEEMSDGFILDLIFELIKEFELHEAAERFRLDGKAVYYPHAADGHPLREVRSMRSIEGTSAVAGSAWPAARQA